MSTHPHRTATRVASILVAITIALVAAASAAHLTVNARDHETASLVPCTTTTLPVTVSGSPSGGNYTAVQISTIPPACNNLPVRVVVYGAVGAQLATGTGTTGTTGTATITTTSYNGTAVVGVAILIDTWGVHTTWTPPSALPSISCIALNNGRQEWKKHTCTVTITGTTLYPNSTPPGGDMMNFTFNVTTDGAHWRVTINFASAGFPWNPMWAGQYNNDTQKPGGYVCPSPITSLELEDNVAFWGSNVNIGQLGAPSWWSGQTICP